MSSQLLNKLGLHRFFLFHLFIYSISIGVVYLAKIESKGCKEKLLQVILPKFHLLKNQNKFRYLDDFREWRMKMRIRATFLCH